MIRTCLLIFYDAYLNAARLPVFRTSPIAVRPFILCIVIVWGCSPHRFPVHTDKTLFPGYESLSHADRKKADSVLTVALDHEGLYTLIGKLKPISSVGDPLRYSLAKDSTVQDGDRTVIHPDRDSVRSMLSELRQWQRITKALSFGDVKFLIIPFKNVYKGQRYLELIVCRQSLIDSVIQAHQTFFGQWGFVPGVDPGVLLTTIEYEEKHDRYRAYGYLFGYPEHAVDFFVEASKTNMRTGEFVKRSFFQIPTYRQPEGHFTYAIPKNYYPTETDSALYRKAGAVLAAYKRNREHFARSSCFEPVSFLRHNYEKSDKHRITSE